MQKPRPNLNLKKEYINEVAGLIRGNGELGEIHFEYLQKVLSDLGFEGDVYENYLAGKGEEKIKEIVEASFQKINSGPVSEDLHAKLKKLWDYLAEEDDIKPADLIYVFGGISQLAVQEAIRLKKENYAPKILFSGKKASYMNDVEMTEAEQYAAQAVKEGVDPEDILIERESVNTPENVVKSAQLLHSIDFLPKRVIAVSLPYHMKRASLTLLAGFNWEFELIRHPGPSAKYSRLTYQTDKNGWSYIFFEYLKLYGARKMGHF